MPPSLPENPTLSILVPVFNEVRCLPELVQRLQAVRFPCASEIVLVDDGSTDGTRELLHSYQGQPGIYVLFQPVNLGKAAAIQTAIDYAHGDLFVIQDADLEYDPCEIPRLLEPILAGAASVVYGSRFLGKVEGMSLHHRFGNRLLTWVTNRLYGTQLTDMETCYKLALAEAFRAFRIESGRFELEPEVTAKLLAQGYTVLEVPISYQGRGRGEGKKISWRDGFGALRVLWKHRQRWRF